MVPVSPCKGPVALPYDWMVVEVEVEEVVVLAVLPPPAAPAPVLVELPLLEVWVVTFGTLITAPRLARYCDAPSAETWLSR